MSNAALKEPPAEEALAEAAARFAVRLTRAVQDSIIHKDDPVARQYLPDARELEIDPAELADPIGDHPHSPVKGIVHRHPGRVLLKIASVCAVNCRFCFRKTMLGTPGETLDRAEIDAAIAYIASHAEISEVILTGGDPLILSPLRLQEVLDRLEALPHIGVLRIHSRVPVADPGRITKALCRALARTKPLYLVIHVNHAQELTPDARQALASLHKSGAVLLSQSVLLKGVNDSEDALFALFHLLTTLRVKPYYLHHPDLVPGTGHFRVSVEAGQLLMQRLRARLSGLALPSYVLDIPGGFGKVPLERSAVAEYKEGLLITDPAGRQHRYPLR